MPGPRRAAGALLAIALVGGAGAAAADGWYFSWHCQGACAAGTPGVDGVEGPYASEGDCDHAQRAKRYDLNSRGDSAGTASACYADDGVGASGGATAAGVHPARVSRLYLSALYGAPWSIAYGNGTHADVGPTIGGELSVGFGHEKLGFDLLLGVIHAPGARELPTDPLDPIWAVWFGIGMQSSPFAIVRRPGLELRPELGAEIGDLHRVSCERCDFSITRKPEADGTFLWRLHAGLDVWLTRRRNHGVAIEVMYQRGTMGSDQAALDDPSTGVSATLAPPTWMLRLSLARRGADFAVH